MSAILGIISNPKVIGAVASIIAILVAIYFQFLSDRAQKKRAEKKRLEDDAIHERDLDERKRDEQSSKKKSRDEQKRMAHEWEGPTNAVSNSRADLDKDS